MTPSQHLARAMRAARYETLPPPLIRAPVPRPAPEQPVLPRKVLWEAPQVTELEPSMRDLLRSVAAAHDLTTDALRGSSRARHIVHARHEFFWRAASGGASYPQIGMFLNVDHTTVLYGASQHCLRTGLPSPRAGRDYAASTQLRLERNRQRHRNRRLADRMTQEDGR